MPDLVRWYEAPDKPIAAKGAIIKTYYGSSKSLMSIKAPEALLRHLEKRYNLIRRIRPPIIGDP